MSRPHSVSQIKGISKARHEKPAEGSKLRRAYDLLITGEVIIVNPKLEPLWLQWGPIRNQLQDFYGLEINTIPGRFGGVQCVGIWDGPYLVPIERNE